jgi:hypothetical protein
MNKVAASSRSDRMSLCGATQEARLAGSAIQQRYLLQKQQVNGEFAQNLQFGVVIALRQDAGKFFVRHVATGKYS